VPPDMVEQYDRLIEPALTRLRRATPAAEFGILRFTGPPAGLGAHPEGSDYRRQGAHPGFFETYVAEAAHLAGDAEWAETSPLPPALPLVVLAGDTPIAPRPGAPKTEDDEDVHEGDGPGAVSAERYDRLWRRHQKELAALTESGTVTLVPGGAHLPLEAPGEVADAVLGLVRRVRGGGS